MFQKPKHYCQEPLPPSPPKGLHPSSLAPTLSLCKGPNTSPKNAWYRNLKAPVCSNSFQFWPRTAFTWRFYIESSQPHYLRPFKLIMLWAQRQLALDPGSHTEIIPCFPSTTGSRRSGKHETESKCYCTAEKVLFPWFSFVSVSEVKPEPPFLFTILLIPASIFAARYEKNSDIAKSAFRHSKLQQELGVRTSVKPKQAIFKTLNGCRHSSMEVCA